MTAAWGGRPRPTVPTVRATALSDAGEVVGHLQDGIPVFVDLRRMAEPTEGRFLDFVSGAAYALAGAVERLAPQGYLVTPRGLEFPVEFRAFLRDRHLAERRDIA